jgi:hypothetical protein
VPVGTDFVHQRGPLAIGLRAERLGRYDGTRIVENDRSDMGKIPELIPEFAGVPDEDSYVVECASPRARDPNSTTRATRSP